MNKPQEAENTLTLYREMQDVKDYYCESERKYFVYRNSNDDTRKSMEYAPADLKGIIVSSLKYML